MNIMYNLGKITRKSGKWGLMLPAVVLTGAAYGIARGSKRFVKGTTVAGTIVGVTAYNSVKDVIKTPVESAKLFIEDATNNQEIDIDENILGQWNLIPSSDGTEAYEPFDI